MSLRSPMSLVLGKGAAGGGAVHHWWMQRVTSVALVPLTLWLVFALSRRSAFDYESMRAWLGSGWTPVWMSLFVVCAVWHSMLGVQVVIEDYVTGKGTKTLTLLLSNFAHGVVGAASLFAVLKIAFA